LPGTGAIFPTSGTNVDRAGAAAWANPGNITADDAAYAEATAASDYLVASAFGFSIPTDATINGVTVIANCSEHSTSTEVVTAQLQNDSAALFGGTDTVTVSGTTLTNYTFGGAADLWGATITPAIVNDPDFGVRLWYTTSHTVRVEWVTMDVQYTEAASPEIPVVVTAAAGWVVAR